MSTPAAGDGVADPRRILLVRLHGLGDTLMTTPALRALRRRYPAAHATMLVGESAAPAVLDNPHLDRLLAVEDSVFFRPRPLALLRLALSLRREAFDLALVFSRSRALRRFTRLSGARRVLGLPVVEPVATNDDLVRARYEVEDGLDLARAAGAEPLGPDMELVVSERAEAHAEAALAGVARPFAVLAPGGGENPGWSMPQKRWPLARFADLAGALATVGLPSVVVGGPADSGAARALSAQARRGTTDATGHSLATSAAIIARGSLLVTNDSVAMHVALITHTPFVALFGPTNRHAVLPATGSFRVLAPDVPCSPCFWQAKPGLAASAGRGRFAACTRYASSCLESINVASVMQAVSELRP